MLMASVCGFSGACFRKDDHSVSSAAVTLLPGAEMSRNRGPRRRRAGFFLLAMPFCCRLRTARAPRVTVALVTVALRRVTPAPGTASAGRRENVRNLRGLEKAALLYLWNPSPRNPGTMTARDLRDFRDLKKRRYCTFGRVAFQADRLGRGHEEPSGRRGNVGIMFWKCPGKWRK